jgi:D-alanine transaminase
MNRKFVPRETAVVDIEDRGYQFGDGVYEVIPVNKNKYFKLDQHLERLIRSAGEIGIFMENVNVAEMKSNLLKLCKLNHLRNGIVYVQITRGVSPRAHPYPNSSVLPQVIAYTIQLSRPVMLQTEGVRCILINDIRWLRCDIKSLNLLWNVMAKQQAVEKKMYEAIFHREDIVTEGSSTNVFIVKNSVIYTHPANQFILNGITRLTILELCNTLNVTVLQTAISIEQLLTADEVFITSSTIEILPVIEVEGNVIGKGVPGSMTNLLQEQLFKLINDM